MARVSPIQTNFTAGEFSPLLEGRVDLTRYNNGVISLENFLILPYGGITRRAGTKYACTAKVANKKVRLIPFQFSTTDTFIIEMGESYFRFYKNEAVVVEAAKVITAATQANPVVVTSNSHGYSNGDEVVISGVVGMTELNGKRFRLANVATNTFELQDQDLVDIDGTGFTAYTSGGTAEKIFELVHTYLESELFELQFAQTADLLYIVHADHEPATLSRITDTSWTLADIVFEGGPFQGDNLDDTHTVNPGATTGSGINVTASTDTWTADDVGSLFKIAGEVSSVQGYCRITVFNSTTSVDVDILETLSSAASTDEWAYGSFSDRFGYPQVVSFHEQRLWFGSTTTEPQTVFASVILIFCDFTAGDADDDALKYEIASEQVNRIRYISSGRGLHIGTSGGVFTMSSGSDFAALTPSNVSVKRDTSYGSELIIPKRIGNFTYYIQRGKRKLREFAYNFDIDANKALDMNLLSEQASESGFTIMDFQQSPNSILWCVRTDGEIATMTRQIDQEVIAWARQKLGSTLSGDSVVESVAVIPVVNGENDQVWVSVKRTVNGTERRYVEFFEDETFTAQEDAFLVDSGLTYSGVATRTITGLDHLEGETVSIFANGSVLPDRTVTNGTITLVDPTEPEVTLAHIGLNYVSEVESLRIEAGSQLGTAQGKIVRIYEIVIRFFKTLGGRVGVRGKDDIIQFRTTTDPMDTATTVFTGDKRVQFPKGYDRQGKWYIRTTQPVPMTILAVMPKMETFDR